MRRRLLLGFFWFACLILTTATSSITAQEFRWTTSVAGEREGAATAGRLLAARTVETKKEWADAVDEYLAILASAGDELVPLSGRHLVQARWRCHRQLAFMPAEALALYRKRVDAQAKKAYDAAAAERDPRQLRRLVSESFCSRPGELALDLLGELAFEQGKMEEAEQWWRLLARPATEAAENDKRHELDFVFPDPQGDVARYRAKQLVARLFRGDPSFAAELKAFRTLHPQSEGWLAGRKGNYGEILQALAAQPVAKEAPRPADVWPSFAGDPTRNRILPSPPDRNWLSRLCEEEPARFDLAKHRVKPTDDDTPPRLKAKVPSSSEEAQAFAFFPILIDHKVAVADPNGITIYDPVSGAVHDWSLEHGARDGGKRETKLPAALDLRYTLTAAGKRLYARLGAPALDPAKMRKDESFLVCLEWNAAQSDLKELWHVAAPRTEQASTLFEGSPLVDGDRAFAAFTRIEDRAVSGVVCVDAATGAPRWKQDVCESAVDAKAGRNRHHVLTLAGPNIVYCSQAGVIAALDAATGKRVWAVRYQPLSDASPRDLTPCLFDGGRLFAAPADYSKLMCLDAGTGRTLWERDNIDVVHLLGVADGRLIFNTREAIRAVDAASGLDEWSAPALALKSFTSGRGIIFGDVILYPSSDGVQVLNVEDGQSTDRLNVPNGRLDGVRGHFAYGGGILAVADRTHLTVFVAPALLRKQRKDDALLERDSARAQYRLAQAETDAGNMEEALQRWKRVEATAKPDERLRGKPVKELAQRERHELLLQAAERMQAAQHNEEAAGYFTRAVDPEFSAALRIRALAVQAKGWERANQPARAVLAWQSILSDSSARNSWVADEKGNPQRASVWAAARIDKALREHGRSAYALVEPQAVQAPGSDVSREVVLATYPHAEDSTALYSQIATEKEAAGARGSATATYRAGIRHCTDSTQRLMLRAQLARLLEKEQCWTSAANTWRQIAQTMQATELAGAVGRAIADAQARRIETIVNARLPQTVGPLWRRAGETILGNGEHLVPLDIGAGADSGDLYFARDRVLICRACGTGSPRWQVRLPWPPNWIARRDDWLIAAGERGIQALTCDKGDLLWSLPAPPADAATNAWDTNSLLSAFQLRRDKLYFLQGERRFFAVDAETGLVLWARWAPDARLGLPYPSGHYFPHFQASGQRVVLQTGAGKWWLLDAADGRLIRDGETVTHSWVQPPTILDSERWCLAVDPQQVILIDATTGKELWRHDVPGRTTSSGVLPLLICNGENLGLLVARNYGYALQRLDPSTGKAMWAQERFICVNPIGLESIALDRDAFFFVAQNTLSAYAVADGGVLWERPLTGGNEMSQVVRVHDQVIVYPAETQAVEFRLGMLFGTIECTVAAPAADSETHGYPVIIADPKTGLLDQRLNFPAPRSSVRFRMDIGAGGLEARVRPVPPPSPSRLRFGAAAATVALPGSLWRLTACKTD
jgi:outer membrane protein assembly factor BamB